MTDAEYDAYRASRSMLRYSALPVLRTLPGDRVPEWACVCPGLEAWKRRRPPWECVSQKEVGGGERAKGGDPGGQEKVMGKKPGIRGIKMKR